MGRQTKQQYPQRYCNEDEPQGAQKTPFRAGSVYFDLVNFLYAYVNSTAVNGISSSDRVVTITPAWQICVYAADAVVGVLAAAGAVLFIIACIKNRKGAQA